MRIAISHVSAAAKSGGSEGYAWALARYLVQHGHETHLLAGRVPSPTLLYPEVELVQFPFTPRQRFPNFGHRFRKLMERLSFGWHCRKYLIEGRFDLLNVHKPYDLPMAAWIRKRTGCKIVWRCHGRDYFAGLGSLLRRADAIYCVSEFARADLQRHYPVEAEVIYTGVDTEFFRPDLEETGRPGAPPRALYFGRLEGWKGVSVFLEALARIKPPVNAHIIGDGPDAARLQTLRDQLGLTELVRLEPALRQRSDVRQALATADIVVFPALAVETLSNAMLEAMAMEKAIVATKVGGFAEVLQPERTALLVPPRDPRALAHAIQILAENDGLRRSLGDAARRDVLDRFDARQSFAKVEGLFSTLVSCPVNP